ncbi:MAG: SusC/RagA family TonB-linked outer membrane protein, partial [Pedobacter sp.]
MINNLKINILAFTFVALLCIWTQSSAQEVPIQIKGTVRDNLGRAMPGVTVNAGPARGTLTNSMGEYTLLKGDQPLTFSYNGFTTQKISTVDKEQLDITLQPDAHKNDEIVYLGYTAQRRGDISGSVSTVTGEELERAPVANLNQTFPGRLAGLTTQEASSELSRASTNLYIRGISAARGAGPLVMIDGIINSYNSHQTLDYISANEIESVTLLKDASTQALYGIQGASGILVVTTKRGNKGDVQIKTTLDQAFQEVTTKPHFYNAAEYASMRNQAAANDGQVKPFTDQQLEGYRSGTDERYPSTNWYDRYMQDYASMQRAAVNVTGGSDNVLFYSNLNFMHQGGQFITDQTEYNPNANNVWVNYRSNVDMKLNRYLNAFVRLSGNVKRERTPGAGNATVYSSLFQIPPTMYGPLSPDGKVLTTQNVASPTYGLLNRTGYVRHTVTNITSQFGLDLDMGFLTKGLKLNGTMAYQTNSVGSLSTREDYERFIRSGANDTLAFIKKGDQNETPLAYSKTHSYYYHLTYNTALNYQRDFGKHNVGAMAYMFFQNLTRTETSSPGLLPYNRVSSGAEFSYGYDRRYLVKFDLGYSGS